MGIVGLLISRGVRFMADGLNGPTNEEARKLLEIRLEEAQARHAEDLERLGREMSEVVAQPLQARLDVARRVERDVRTALCASMSECTDVAARRVAGERDLARAERDRLSQACESWRKLDAPLSEFRRVLRVGDYESTLDAARRMSRELEVCLGQLDHVMAREKSIQLEAYALGRKSAEDQEAEWESERKELVAARDETYGNMKALCDGHVEAYAVLGAKIGESLLGAARRVVAERDAARAIRDEAIARAEKAEAELEAARASASLVTMVGDIGVRNSGDATRLEAILAERDALAAELAAIRAATGEDPTDEVLFAVDQKAWYAATGHIAGRIGGRRALYNLGRNAALGEVARMREEVATAKAHAEPAYRTVKSIGEILSVEPDYEKVTDKVRDTANEVATLRDRVDGLEIDLNSAVQNSKACEVEANNLRSSCRALRARVAELEASTKGQPVATDEELRAIGEEAYESVRNLGIVASRAMAYAAVARHVRAERPACLVARAVALGEGISVVQSAKKGRWYVTANMREQNVPAADVPATLARLLDEVDAARKGGAK